MSVYPEGIEVQRHASISANGLYRFSLHRDWYDYGGLLGGRPRWVTCEMLNPSTADAAQDDPTIARCVRFARRLGATGLAVVNLYAYRATKPADLWKAPDPVGPSNDHHLAMFLAMAARSDFPIIAAWGSNARPERVAEVLRLPHADRLQALGVTKDGAPRHPLYLRADAPLAPWSAA